MSDQMKESIVAIDKLLTQGEEQMKKDLDTCISNAQSQNCSSLNVWEHQRKKHSKNITNMQNKIENHQKTIEKIMDLNQKETQKKQLTLNALLPKIQNLKNTIEYIENIEWLIKDTYVNIEDSQQSLLHLFDVKSHQQIQSIMAELMRKQDFHDPGAKPSQQDYLPEHVEIPPKPEQKFNQGPPLIDEDIFDGHNEQYGDPHVPQLFGDNPKDKILQADYIPDGVNIPEHDDQAKEIDDIIKKYLDEQKKNQQDVEEEDTDLNLDNSEQIFKDNVKKIGESLFQRLRKFRDQVQQEEDSLVQAVADLEKAIYNLHHKHASQIVQIYIETKKLQREIFEKDDIVLALDSKIHDCKDISEIIKECEQNKVLDEEYLENLRAQKAINSGIVKELAKLMLYEDKNVELPSVKPEEVKVKAQEVVNEIESEKQQELEEIKEAEKEVEANEPQEIQKVQPVVQPTEEKPVEEKPIEEKPVEEKSVEEKPIEEKPVEEKQVEEKPVEEKPIEEKLVEEKPAETPAEEALLVKLMKDKKEQKNNLYPHRRRRSQN